MGSRWRKSPIPVFSLDSAKTDPASREFVWELEGNLAEEDTIKPKLIEQRGVKSDKVRIDEARTKALELLRDDYKDGIFTKEEYKSERQKIIDKYNKGGKI